MITINEENPTSPDTQQLLTELSNTLAALTGSSGQASFDLSDVQVARACFVLARDAHGVALGCGALRPLQAQVAELKRMYARSAGRGVGSALLAHLEQRAREFGYQELWLETRKINQRAVNFYLTHGYREIPKYGKYAGNPLALCLAKALG
jgi:ribosomal protein S18 acetylase RimI-like enzyme